MAEFKKLLPKSKKADEYLKDLENIEINRVGSYLVKSFSAPLSSRSTLLIEAFA